MPVDGIGAGRATQGVIVMRLREGEHVSTLAPVVLATRRTARGWWRSRERSHPGPSTAAGGARGRADVASQPPRITPRSRPLTVSDVSFLRRGKWEYPDCVAPFRGDEWGPSMRTRTGKTRVFCGRRFLLATAAGAVLAMAPASAFAGLDDLTTNLTDVDATVNDATSAVSELTSPVTQAAASPAPAEQHRPRPLRLTRHRRSRHRSLRRCGCRRR